MPNVVIVAQTVRVYIRKYAGNTLTAFQDHFRSSEPYELVIHSKHSPVSYRFPDKRRFPSKVFIAPADRVRSPCNSVTAVVLEKIPDSQKV